MQVLVTGTDLSTEIAGDFHGIGQTATTRCLIEVASRRPSPHWVPDFLEVDRAASLIETVRQDDQKFW
jgi:hypothetical protein